MRFGLREKMMLFLAGGVLLIGGVTLVMVYSVQERIQLELIRYSVERYVLLHREKTLGGIQGDLILARKMADSEVLRRWVLDPSDAHASGPAVRELGSLIGLFSTHVAFVASKSAGYYYFADAKSIAALDGSARLEPTKLLNTTDKEHEWFYKTLANPEPYHFNVAHDAQLNQTKLWINVVMKAGNEAVGVVGTGIDITQFIETFIKGSEQGVTGLFVNEDGAIQGHADPALIALNAPIQSERASSTIWKLLANDQERSELKSAMNRVKLGGGSDWVGLTLQGTPRVAGVAYLAPLKWYTIAVFDRSSVLGTGYFLVVLIAMVAAMLASVLAVFEVANRLVVIPLRQVADGTRRVTEGDFSVRLPERRSDEIGEVMAAFNRMTCQIAESRRLLQTNVATITAALQRAGGHEQLARVFFSNVAPLLDLGLGGFHRLDGTRGVLVACGGYARARGNDELLETPLGFGLVGQCAIEQRTIMVDHLPPDYPAIGSMLGSAPPTVLMLVPIMHAGTLLGVIELASFRRFREEELTLLDGLLTVVAMCMEIIERNERGKSQLLESSR
ncbi:MAG: HAMP domain-containing protein [Magnetococcales bacterium]|nr:HAMP domain-containing protein [Magnetococcales bacterium]